MENQYIYSVFSWISLFSSYVRYHEIKATSLKHYFQFSFQETRAGESKETHSHIVLKRGRRVFFCREEGSRKQQQQRPCLVAEETTTEKKKKKTRQEQMRKKEEETIDEARARKIIQAERFLFFPISIFAGTYQTRRYLPSSFGK